MVKLLELFGGIGACSKALERCGIDYEIADYVEIDKYAVKSYNAIHGTNFEPQDITTWDKDINVDLIMHGSPCQDFSIAGNNAGGDEGSGTRSSLMYETIRIVKKLKPRVVIWENVKNLLSKKHRHNFDAYLEYMHKLGYENYYKVLNAKNYGIPQNRERIFTISIRGAHTPFIFPDEMPLELRLKDILEPEVDEKYYLSDAMLQYFERNTKKQEENGNGFRFKPTDGSGTAKAITTREGGRMDDNFIIEPQINTVGLLDIKGNEQVRRVYESDGIAPTLNSMQGGNRQPKVIVHDVPEIVKVRKYKVDKEKLVKVLRERKKACKWTNKELAKELEQPLTLVEHWFRNDDSFAIPQPEIWEDLKYLLEMDDITEFDESIMTFEEREGVYEKSNRVYDANGISATITRTDADLKIIEPFIAASRGRNPDNPNDRTQGAPTVQRLEPKFDGTTNTITTVQKDNYVVNTDLRVRKLTPLECWRLMGFDDEDFYKSEAVNSNTQLYKQAGNSIVVNVLCEIFNNLREVLEMDKTSETTLVTFETDKFFDVAALAEKEPELFEELVNDYPVTSGTYQYKVG